MNDFKDLNGKEDVDMFADNKILQKKIFQICKTGLIKKENGESSG